MGIFDQKNSWVFLTKKTKDIYDQKKFMDILDKKTKDILDKKIKRKPYLCTPKTPLR